VSELLAEAVVGWWGLTALTVAVLDPSSPSWICAQPTPNCLRISIAFDTASQSVNPTGLCIGCIPGRHTGQAVYYIQCNREIRFKPMRALSQPT
jgi:hypothetical protein